jgi:phosphoribosyl-ATP pyrophosphohydrolase/phosphoribosyl-AMP cyclohydrolase/histidinol dehydrogenase
MSANLPRVSSLPVRRPPVDPEVLARAGAIVEDVRRRGEVALREHGERHGDLAPGQDLVLERARLEERAEEIAEEDRGLLVRVAGRIRSFAAKQRESIVDLDVDVTGGGAGHRWLPVSAVGAYVPGGRYPLPSSMLMTVIPARVAGVDTVWAASPRPTGTVLAAAVVAGADGVLALGGAQAVAALAFGTVTPACDMIVGPGNKWVTAAKKHLYGEVGIDGLAGPSEILVIADDSADAGLVAADLLAQAEHDVEAIPSLVTTSDALADRVDAVLTRQLADLPTSETAAAALGNGFTLVVRSIEEAVRVSDRLAPEHLALHVEDPDVVAASLRAYGSVFVGGGSAEAFADYGVGPNHVLPTGGGARYRSGLSVLTFLRSPTWSRLDDPTPLIEDTVRLARLEGLEAHARAAQLRAR